MDHNTEKPVFDAKNPALDQSVDDNFMIDLLLWVLGSLVLIVIVYIAIGGLAGLLANRISDEQESKWFGPRSVLPMDKIAGFDNTPPHPKFTEAQQLFARLLQVKQLRKLPYNLKYSPSADANAFATPGGGIILTKGFLNLVESSPGIAMVLGHEIGHIEHRDTLKTMGRSLLMVSIIGIFLGGDSTVASLVVGLMENSYSRDQESMADDFGFRLMYSALGEVKGAAEFFEKIEKHASQKVGKDKLPEATPGFDGRLLSLFSTHPYTPDRVLAIRKLEEEVLSKSNKSEAD